MMAHVDGEAETDWCSVKTGTGWSTGLGLTEKRGEEGNDAEWARSVKAQ